MQKRDKTLDRLRCLAMLWVIVVHVLYWGNYIRHQRLQLLMSFILFEMPLFFFVTGAGNSFSKITGWFRFVYKRWKRILIPYWFFAVICAALTIGCNALSGDRNLLYGVQILFSWLIPIDRQINSVPYLTWALWFIPVYLCVILVLPVLKRMHGSKRPFAFLALLTVLFVGTCVFQMGWIQNVVFYALWTYVGLFYRDILTAIRKRRVRWVLALSAIVGMAVIYFLHAKGFSVDMQANKFPPSLIFGIFSVSVMSLILMLIPGIESVFEFLEKWAPARRLLHLYSSRSLTIYLYQVFAFNLTLRFTDAVISGTGLAASLVKSILCLVVTIPVCAAFATVFGCVEDLGTEKFL